VVIHAGPEILLAMSGRYRRFPIKLRESGALAIAWTSNDGLLEHVTFEGSRAVSDHAMLMHDFERKGMLIAEVNDLENPDTEEASYHLVERHVKDSLSERGA